MVGHRVEVAQGDVLELLLDRADTKPVRQRRIDLHRFKRLVAALLLGHDLDRAHVVQPVGQLDDDHAHILRHGEQHLAHVLRLLLLAEVKLILPSLVTPSTSSATSAPNCFWTCSP